MLSGLYAFPLTPLDEHQLHLEAFTQIIGRLAEAKIDGICVAGSTGSYAYLNHEERALLVKLAVEGAPGIPVMVGVGSNRQRDVLRHLDDAQKAGAASVLLAPLSYQPLSDGEVFKLYEAISQASSIPVCVYINPRTTHFDFSEALITQICRLPNIASVKFPGAATEPREAAGLAQHWRDKLPETVSLGVSGDAFAWAAISGGFDIWYSVLAGLYPEICQALLRSAERGTGEINEQLAPVWQLFQQHGSLRVVAAMAQLAGITPCDGLPRPLLPVAESVFTEIHDVMVRLQL
ncbi:dihydrodipicolinate synthase family protein [Mangrovibacter yixingensis]|uniref:dihydrodipicolinate synthase family protein n=1 Tax=Mangrovibacter yixingensis TaxID=1529639 RepID=UPI001CFA679E|nr:dihydrodipicolinate synthase family protein [Mangrovibacter yixingensis]